MKKIKEVMEEVKKTKDKKINKKVKKELNKIKKEKIIKSRKKDLKKINKVKKELNKEDTSKGLLSGQLKEEKLKEARMLKKKGRRKTAGKKIMEVKEGSHLIYGREGATGPRNKNEICIHSFRGGDVIGEHTVIFAGDGERFEISHKAHSRRAFVHGTLAAAKFIISKAPGLYSMEDLLGLEE